MSVTVIAESGVNHYGKWERALDLAEIAREKKARFIRISGLSREEAIAVRKHCEEIGIVLSESGVDYRDLGDVIDIGVDVMNEAKRRWNWHIAS